jgi:16S rRNA (adenine1518-N6/adenine1519-N6)-dimethyltransferase
MALTSIGGQAGLTSTSSNRRWPKAKKRFGQHFLSDPNILTRIVDAAEIDGRECVLEVGPGLGSLTAVLAERASRVIAVEVDRDLVPLLRERFAESPNVAIVEADVLDHTPGELLARGDCAAPYVVVANLPYNIAAPVLRRFLEADMQPRRMVVMVQLEVAEAIVAKPGKMSLLSVATQVYADTSMVMKVPPGAFSPPPKVDSAAVRLDVRDAPAVDVPLETFFKVVRAGFGNPRKQLRNSLSFGLYAKQSVIDDVMTDAGVDATLRPQVLSLKQWASITRAWIARRGA